MTESEPLRGAASHAGGLRTARPTSPTSSCGAGLRGQPGRRIDGGAAAHWVAAATWTSRRRAAREGGGRRQGIREAGAAVADQVRRDPGAGEPTDRRAELRRPDGYSGVSANPGLGAARSAGPARWHGVSGGNGGNLRRGTPADAARGSPGGRREAGGLMRWWEGYTASEGAEINANPSPGNKAGGLTTILEKSLGAMAKAGSTDLVDVVQLCRGGDAKGFVFMDTPGYDPVSATGQVAGGANSCASPLGAAACSAASRRHRSSSPPTRRCTSGWKTTWT